MYKSAIKTILLSFFLITHFSLVFTQVKPAASNQLISDLEKLVDKPSSINFQNTLKINNQGGHLQGIQYLNHKKKNYYILSGSSDQYSYYAVVKTGKENRVISINKILEKPFKHAGGFQIFENLMAIGVEDNDAKERSKVFIFNIDNPEKPPEQPLTIIERMGESRRATAGCVGITIIRDKILVVVGDWDTKHLDFYSTDRKKLGLKGEAPELKYSMDISKTDRTGWIDDKWLAYQNINFLKDNSGNLFMAGMTSDENGKNILDVFKVETDDMSSFRLIKIYTQRFTQNEQTRFIWGAGIYVTEDKKLKIISSSEHIEENSIINIFE